MTSRIGSPGPSSGYGSSEEDQHSLTSSLSSYCSRNPFRSGSQSSNTSSPSPAYSYLSDRHPSDPSQDLLDSLDHPGFSPSFELSPEFLNLGDDLDSADSGYDHLLGCKELFEFDSYDIAANDCLTADWDTNFRDCFDPLPESETTERCSKTAFPSSSTLEGSEGNVGLVRTVPETESDQIHSNVVEYSSTATTLTTDKFVSENSAALNLIPKNCLQLSKTPIGASKSETPELYYRLQQKRKSVQPLQDRNTCEIKTSDSFLATPMLESASQGDNGCCTNVMSWINETDEQYSAEQTGMELSAAVFQDDRKTLEDMKSLSIYKNKRRNKCTADLPEYINGPVTPFRINDTSELINESIIANDRSLNHVNSADYNFNINADNVNEIEHRHMLMRPQKNFLNIPRGGPFIHRFVCNVEQVPKQFCDYERQTFDNSVPYNAFDYRTPETLSMGDFKINLNTVGVDNNFNRQSPSVGLNLIKSDKWTNGNSSLDCSAVVAPKATVRRSYSELDDHRYSSRLPYCESGSSDSSARLRKIPKLSRSASTGNGHQTASGSSLLETFLRSREPLNANLGSEANLRCNSQRQLGTPSPQLRQQSSEERTICVKRENEEKTKDDMIEKRDRTMLQRLLTENCDQGTVKRQKDVIISQRVPPIENPATACRSPCLGGDAYDLYSDHLISDYATLNEMVFEGGNDQSWAPSCLDDRIFSSELEEILREQVPQEDVWLQQQFSELL